MLLQVGFADAFAAGLMTFISAVGALVMKTTAPPILRRFGFRSVLIANGVICAATFMIYALFKIDTPHWLIMVALAVGGFFRSLQFTSLNGMAYADLEQDQMSRHHHRFDGPAVHAVGLHHSAATMLHFLMLWRGETHRPPPRLRHPSRLSGRDALSLFWFVRLPWTGTDERSEARLAKALHPLVRAVF
jgi:hypothetical protein